VLPALVSATGDIGFSLGVKRNPVRWIPVRLLVLRDLVANSF